MQLWQPWKLRDAADMTAHRVGPVWWSDGIDDDLRRSGLRLRLFRRNYPRADKRAMRHQIRPRLDERRSTR